MTKPGKRHPDAASENRQKPPPLPTGIGPGKNRATEVPRIPIGQRSGSKANRQSNGPKFQLWLALSGSGFVVVCIVSIVYVALISKPNDSTSKPNETQNDSADPSTVSTASVGPQSPVPVGAENEFEPPRRKMDLFDDLESDEVTDSELPGADNRSSEEVATITGTEPADDEPLAAPEGVGELNGESDPLTLSEVKETSARDVPEMAQTDVPGNSAAGADTLLAAAAELVRARKGKEAITTLKKASNLFPKDIRADFYLGLLHSGVGINDPKIAETHFKRVLDRSPAHIGALNNLALVALIARKFEPARNFLMLAAKSKPRPMEVDQNIGRLLIKVEQLRIPASVTKQFGGFEADSRGFRPQTGWLYMPPERSESSQSEYKSFCIGGVLEDRACVICNGKRKARCGTCIGTGFVLADSTTSATLQTGLGPMTRFNVAANRIECSVCKGSRTIDCTFCADGHDPALGK